MTEDWSAGGAGNGLGTLYAFKKAAALANDLYDEDLLGLLYKGSISTALFHTAGKGTRLAPLPAAENNNKPGVRLPANIAPGRPMTVLESVILQTGVYAPSRKGRLSVYWGDQIFIPSVDPLYTPANHVDIMCTLGSMVGEDEWKEKGLEKYGVIGEGAKHASGAEHRAMLSIERCRWERPFVHARRPPPFVRTAVPLCSHMCVGSHKCRTFI